MSTEYYTNPPIKYEDFIKKTSLRLAEPKEKVFINEHKLIYLGQVHIYVIKNENGNCEFIRYGNIDSKLFLTKISEEFNVKVFDEFGIEYRDYL